MDTLSKTPFWPYQQFCMYFSFFFFSLHFFKPFWWRIHQVFSTPLFWFTHCDLQPTWMFYKIIQHLLTNQSEHVHPEIQLLLTEEVKTAEKPSGSAVNTCIHHQVNLILHLGDEPSLISASSAVRVPLKSRDRCFPFSRFSSVDQEGKVMPPCNCCKKQSRSQKLYLYARGLDFSQIRARDGGGPNICSVGREQKQRHVRLFMKMTFLQLPSQLIAAAVAAVLLSARLPQAWLGSRARISPHLPKFPLTKCHDYTFLLLHWRL